MGFRTVCASIVCKSTYRLLRLMKRGGTSLPGKLALRVDPNYLNTLAKGVRTLVLTGTNGKTTSSRRPSRTWASRPSTTAAERP